MGIESPQFNEEPEKDLEIESPEKKPREPGELSPEEQEALKKEMERIKGKS